MSWLHRDLETMDPSRHTFVQFSPSSNGLPQESKLATYMNRSTSTPTRSLSQGMSTLNLEPSPTSVRKELPLPEFVPMNYYSPPAMLAESPGIQESTLIITIPTTQQVHQENVGGTTYFYSTNSDGLNTSGAINASASAGGTEACHNGAVLGAASPYGTQMYSGTPTHMGPSTSKSGLASSFYMPETIISELYQRKQDPYNIQNDLRQYSELPENVEMYTNLILLEAPEPHSLMSTFRATHRQSGDHYALLRLHSMVNPVANNRLEMWKQIDHPNIMKLHEWFITAAFGDHSLMLVYAYNAGSVSLTSKYLSGAGGTSAADSNGAFHDPFSSDPDAPRPYTHQKNAMLRAVACGALLPESVLWSLLVQLTAALRSVHIAGLACRNLDPRKVMMDGCRVRIAWSGAADVYQANNVDINQAQQDDLTALGRLALALACRNIHCDNLNTSMDLVTRTYSADLKNLILYLLSATARRSVTDLMPMIGARFYTQVEALERRADITEHMLAQEMDNGRLLRILVKMAFINERPELNRDPAWSETGDRYMLKLFRDYLFHTVTDDGRPWIDQAHMVYCLNQLDSGSTARVQLMCRGERSLLVVSFAELKNCLEKAFDELMHSSMMP